MYNLWDWCISFQLGHKGTDKGWIVNFDLQGHKKVYLNKLNMKMDQKNVVFELYIILQVQSK